MSPAGLAVAFAALAAITLAIGAGFAMIGAWLVLPFAGLEVLLLVAAYLAYARRAADYERIVLDSGRLTVEVGKAQRIERYEMEARRARVSLEEQRVVVRGACEQLELGRHLDAQARVLFAAELRKRLQI